MSWHEYSLTVRKAYETLELQVINVMRGTRKLRRSSCFLRLDVPALQFTDASVQHLRVPCFSRVAPVLPVVLLSQGSDFLQCAPLVRPAVVATLEGPCLLDNHDRTAASGGADFLASQHKMAKRKKSTMMLRVLRFIAQEHILQRDVVQNFDVVERNLDVNVPQILAEIAGEPVVDEPVPQVPEALVEVELAVDAAKVLLQERGQLEYTAPASEQVRRSHRRRKRNVRNQQEQPTVTKMISKESSKSNTQ